MMRVLSALTRVETLMFLRNPMSVFMALLLPSLLLMLQAFVIPGALEPFGGGGALSELRRIDFFVPVSAAVAIASVAITNYPAAVGAYREAGVLRRLDVTPVGAHRVLLAQWAVSGLSLVAALLFAFALAGLTFGAAPPMNPALAALVIVTGAIAMMAVGSVIAAVAGTAQIAYGLGFLVFIACLFTAGMWTPGPLMPETTEAIATFTPMGAMTLALTDAWYTGSSSLVPFAVMALWALPAGVIAVRAFRWR